MNRVLGRGCIGCLGEGVLGVEERVNRGLGSGAERLPPSASIKGILTDNSQVDILGPRYTSVNFGAKQSPVSPRWWTQIN